MKDAVIWLYNHGERPINLSDLGIYLRPQFACDIFKANPSLTWPKYQKSLKSGTLATKAAVVSILTEEPKTASERDIVMSTFDSPPVDPIASRGKTTINVGQGGDSDYLALVEAEFPSDAQQLGQTEMWKAEREKFIKSMNGVEFGEDGEVFSDNLFEKEYLSD